MAFEFGDQTYTEPNRTFISYAPGTMKVGKDKGCLKAIKGYWADIVVSPYFTFGYDSDTPNAYAEGLYQILNKGTGTEQHRHHTVEIAVYNLLSYLWEIETGNPYLMSKANDIFSGLGNEQGRLRNATAEQQSGTKAGITESASALIEEESCEVGDYEGLDENREGKPCASNSTGNTRRDDHVPSETGTQPCKLSEEEQMDELTKELYRAECIGESFDNFKVCPQNAKSRNLRHFMSAHYLTWGNHHHC